MEKKKLAEKDLIFYLKMKPERVVNFYKMYEHLYKVPLSCTIRKTILEAALDDRNYEQYGNSKDLHENREAYRAILEHLITKGVWQDNTLKYCEYSFPQHKCSQFYELDKMIKDFLSKF
jgi:hypothetical protein